MDKVEVVWSSKLDKRWDCRVLRTGFYTGTLQIFDGDVLFHEEPTALSYGAQFGPDQGDIAEWQDRCVQLIDGRDVM